MRTIFKWFVDHPKLINLFLVLVLIMGGLSFLNLKRNSTPNVDFKMMFVTTIYPGAAPEDVEINVTIPIEEQLQEVSGIKDMESFSGENYSLVFVEIDPDAKDIEEVKSDVNKAVDRVTGLPSEILDKPLVTELKTDIFPVFEVAITGNHTISEFDLRKYAKTLEDKIRHLPGVGGTSKVGYRKREVHIEVDPVKASRHYVSLAEVMVAIRASNIRLSGGNIQSLTTKKKVITLSQFDDPLEVKDVIVRSVFSGKRIMVSEVAEVKDSFEEESILVSTNSEPCINITISKNANADAVRVAKRVKVLLDEFNKELPEGVHAQIVKDYSVYVNAMLRAVISNALLGFLLVLLCLMIFLDHRIAFWTALGIPFSLLVAFYFMPFYDISITNISLLGFIIVLGMLVDDAIVVAEHIFSYREKGLGPIEASIKGVSEIFWPVLATVTTTIAAFLPILLMGGIWGDFIRAIPIVITIVLLASLFESAFILPSHLAHTQLKKKEKPKILQFLEKAYHRNLLRVLKRKYMVIGAFLLIFFFSIGILLPILGFQLMPTSDADVLMIKLETPKGTPLQETEKRVNAVEKILVETIPKDVLISYVTTLGEKGTDMWDSVSGISQDHWARININLSPAQERKISSFQLKDKLEDRFKTCKERDKFVDIGVITRAGGPPTGRPIDVSFIGNNDKIRTKLGDEFYNFISKNPAVSDIFRNDEKGLKELNIILNHNLMSELGITAAEVAGVVRAAISGNVVTSIRQEGEEVDFRVMLDEKYRNDPQFIRNLTIPNRMGKLIRLGSFISFKEKSSPLAISHQEGDRVLNITAELDRKKQDAGEYNKAIMAKFEPMVAQYPDMRMTIGGEEEYARESLNNFFNAMVLALIVIYLILVVLFNSFTEPFIVLMAIPFGLVGVILAFLIHREPMSFLGLIGILGLAGVVVNNSLVMLKFLNKKEEEVCGKGERLTLETIADAAMLRFRPIVLTTITTVAGLLPSLYGLFGGRVDFLFPLLLSLSWGLVFSAFITLFLIPSFYIVERNINVWFSKKFGRSSKEDICRLDISNY
ncbi:MAG: efflux RND transporter permease subunit [Candidatus Margulisiibacteriota bacterium]|nr:efflux RND transporter permease subunit [Candidatus Margulisiibacteriota bacterium]